jgi:REP element-mobilizing transposase RayT
MSHPYVRNFYHLIFSTKDRRSFIKAAFQNDVYDQIRYVAVEYGASVEAIGGTEDHVHVLLQLPAKLAIAAMVCALKAKSSKWMGDHGHLFAWQSGYGCFTVSSSALPAVREYIGNQEEHHRRRSFDDEFAAMLKKHGIERRADGRFMDVEEPR